MYKTFTFCVSLILLNLFSACDFSCRKIYFNENEKYWITPYKKGNIEIFQSNLDSLKRDTIFILENTHTLPTGNCNPSVSNVDPESYIIDYKYSHNGKMSDSNYLIQHVKEIGLSLPVIRIYDIEFNGETLKDTTVVLKNFGIQQCHIFSNFQDFNNLPDFKIKNFIWSKNLGLVQIKLHNGEEYELIEKQQSKK